MTATLLFAKRHNLGPRDPLPYPPDTFSRENTPLSRDHKNRDVEARQHIAPVHRRMVLQQRRGVIVAHQGALPQGPVAVLSSGTLREHPADQPRRGPLHVPPQLESHARVEDGGQLSGLLGRPARIGCHAGGLVHQDEARDEGPGLGREDVEEGPDDGTAHRVRHDVDSGEPELREEV
ncbi:AB hydrolase superfamily protein YdjP [Cytospora mali]|uniref:AB hydrolase superfamily protein YdjP n=1 Tax=Cytospora mali TaxID=578113 RepID=A0A194VXB1_CYTMA|nr:AB hydrolase superfamily protein YdjP [Valsa mali]